MSTTYNMAIVGSASALVATLNVIITYGIASSVVATSGSKTIALTYDSTNDIWTGNLDSTGMWTVYATDGVRTVSQTVNVDAIGVYDISIAAPNVPLGYTQLEWISSDGAYIDTGYYPVSACTYEIKYALLNTSGYKAVAIAVGTNATPYLAWRVIEYDTYEGSNYGYFYSNQSSYDFSKFSNANNTNIHTVRASGATCKFDNTTQTLSYGTRCTSNSAATMKICYSGVKMYYFTMTEPNSTTLVRDMVPVKRQSDSEVGMWDKVNNVFYASANSSKFTAGPEVN